MIIAANYFIKDGEAFIRSKYPTAMDEMSAGVSYFEQFVWHLEHRGVADIDIPVLILGVTT